MKLSRNYKNDNLGTSSSWKPIVAICNYNADTFDYDVLWCIGYDSETVYSKGGTFVTVPCLKSVSDAKFDVNLKKKSLSISKIRIVLHNYLDENTKITDIGYSQSTSPEAGFGDSTTFDLWKYNLEGKYAFVFYKTPSTDQMDLYNPFVPEEVFSDRGMPFIFFGVCQRSTFNEKQISLQIEDFTQQEIADKQVPYYDATNMPSYITTKVGNKYLENSCPMTFGKVDHASSYIYYSDPDVVSLLADSHSVQSTHTLFKIPSAASIPSAHGINDPEDCAFVFKDDFFMKIISDTSQNLSQAFSNIGLPSHNWSMINQYTNKLVPEVSFGIRDFHKWRRVVVIERRPISFHWNDKDFVYGSGGSMGTSSILNLASSSYGQFGTGIDPMQCVHTGTWDPDSNEDPLSFENKWGYDWTWRTAEEIEAIPWWVLDSSQGNEMSFGGWEHGCRDICYFCEKPLFGRWLLFEYEECPDLQLVNVNLLDENGNQSSKVGNTLFMADWSFGGITTSWGNYCVNAVPGQTLPATWVTDYIGWWVSPIEPDIFLDVIKNNWIVNPHPDSWEIMYSGLISWNEDQIETLANYEGDTAVNPSDLVHDVDNPWGTSVHRRPTIGRTNDSYHIPGQYIGVGRSHAGFSGTKNFTWDNPDHRLNGRCNGQGWGNRTTTASDIHHDIPNLPTAAKYNKLIVWEAGTKWMKDEHYSYEMALAIKDPYLQHFALVDDIRAEEIYICVTGRKGGMYTSEVSLADTGEEYVEANMENLFALNEPINSLLPPIYERLDALNTLVYTADIAIVNNYINSMFNRTNEPEQYILNSKAVWFDDYVANETLSPSALQKTEILWACWDHIIFLFATAPVLLFNQITTNYEDWDTLFPGGLAEHDEAFELMMSLCYNFGDSFRGIVPSFILGGSRQVILNLLKSLCQEEANMDEAGYGDGSIFTGDFFPFLTASGELVALMNELEEFLQSSWFFSNSQEEDYSLNDHLNNFETFFNSFISLTSQFAVRYFKTILVSTPQLALDAAIIEQYAQNIQSDMISYQNLETFGSDLVPFANQASSIYAEAFGTYNLGNAYPWTFDYSSPSYVIQKPCDIVLNILVCELGVAKFYKDQTIVTGGGSITPDFTKFDLETIYDCRLHHGGWKMGFSINTKVKGQQLIEDILSESKCFFRYTRAGKMGFTTIRDAYAYEDIQYFIEETDLLTFKLSRTPREDIITSISGRYKYNAQENAYRRPLKKIAVDDFFINWEGYDFYNITKEDSEMTYMLKYHVDEYSAHEFQRFMLFNNFNQHNVVELELPTKYLHIEIGDLIFLPLLNGTKFYGEDYSTLQWRNGQPIYPIWMVTSIKIGAKKVKIEAYQLHHLGAGDDYVDWDNTNNLGYHGFIDPNQLTSYCYITNQEGTSSIVSDVLETECIDQGGTPMTEEETSSYVGCTREYSNYYNCYGTGEPLRLLNYDPNAIIDDGVELLPYDFDGTGVINIIDIYYMLNYIMTDFQLTEQQIEIGTSYSLYDNEEVDNIIGIVDIIDVQQFLLQGGGTIGY